MFATISPGWYSSRTIHIHFRITLASTKYLVTQLLFDDSIDDGLVSTQPIYKDRGSRDTANQDDTVVSASAAPDYPFTVSQQSDGSMLAYKTLITWSTWSSTTQTECTMPAGSGGAMGGGTAGGPPQH